MFSGDYDKALAALILANTAKEINVDVTMFFAFWGLMLVGMMEDSDTPPLSAFMKGALTKGVNMKACKLSCEVMGFGEEELLKEVTVVTAEDYLLDALDSDIQLFI